MDAATWAFDLPPPTRAEAVMVGDKRKYVVLLIVPDFDRLEKWASQGVLMLNASLATTEPVLKMHNVIDLHAPWMGDEERGGYVKLLGGLDLYQRIQAGRDIGDLLYLRNEEREALRLTQFKPIDMTVAATTPVVAASSPPTSITA